MPNRDKSGPPVGSKGPRDGRGNGKGRASGKGAGTPTGGKKGKCLPDRRVSARFCIPCPVILCLVSRQIKLCM